jgi:hypothetical protein
VDSEHSEGGGHQDGTDDGRVDVCTIKPGQFVVGSFFTDNTCEICRAGSKPATPSQEGGRRERGHAGRTAATARTRPAAHPVGYSRIDMRGQEIPMTITSMSAPHGRR